MEDNNPNRPRAFKTQVYEDIREWARTVDKGIDEHSTGYWVFKSILAAVAIISIVLDIAQIVTARSARIIIWIILLSIILILIVLDSAHAYTARNRRDLLVRKNRQLQSTIRIIRTATDLTPSKYIVKSSEIRHEISEKGDDTTTRTMRIGFLDSPVNWVKIRVGVIDGKPEDKSEDLHIRVENADDKCELPWTTIDDQPDRKELAILLDPPIKTFADESSFTLRGGWRGAYLDLISGKVDSGRLTVDNLTEKLSLVFIAPKGIEFAGIKPTNLEGKFTIDSQENGQSILKFEAANIQPGSYPYKLHTKKKEPQ
jgi:hypothetical protein